MAACGSKLSFSCRIPCYQTTTKKVQRHQHHHSFPTPTPPRNFSAHPRCIAFEHTRQLGHRITHTATMSSSSLKPSTIAAISVGTIVAGIAAYAVYFDHKRRTDPEFRKQLKKESKRQARAAKEEAEAHGKEQKKAIREAVERANEEGFPKDPEEVEAYFMQEVAQGEGMVQSGMDTEPAAPSAEVLIPA